LRNAAEFVDKLMEIDEELCTSWSCAELVLAIMEAIKQIGYFMHLSSFIDFIIYMAGFNLLTPSVATWIQV